jgi:TonB-dependent starch-binding outer membrane protein SusC
MVNLARLQTFGRRHSKLLVVMKLTALLILVACLQVSGNGYSQRVTLKVTNASLEEVFREIKIQSGFGFTYTTDVLKNTKPVTLHLINEPIEKVLHACLQDQGLQFKFFDRVIVISKSSAITPPLEDDNQMSSRIDIKGRVVNEKGEPVAGVTVTVKGSKIATYTNQNGEFSLNTVEADAVLVFTSVNMETFEVEVSGRLELAITLKTKVTALGDVTVTPLNTGYQILKPNEVTGSVVVITKEQLDQRVAPDVISKLEGITNGLVFHKDAGNGKNILRIRGESTLFGHTEPLIIVDNFPYQGDINEINPNDVESITILKDAAAAAIWGMRAGNGVIVITTKKGRINQPMRIQLNANTTITEKPDLFYSPLISSSDFIDLEIFLFGKGKYNAELNDANKKAVSPVVEILNSRKLGLISSSDSASRINALRNNDWRDDYLEHIYRKPVSQQYQVNLSGGSAKSSYYFSAGYDKAVDAIIGNENNRITLSSHNSYKPFKQLELQFGLGYTENTIITNGFNSIPNFYPYMSLVDENGFELPVPQRRAVWEDTIANRGFINWKYYPLQEKNYRDIKNRSYSTRVSTGLKYDVISGLSVEVSYQYYRGVSNVRDLKTKESYIVRDNINRFAIVTNGNYTGTNYPNGGVLNNLLTDLVSHNGRFVINYNTAWSRHAVSALAGLDVNETRAETNGNRLYGYNDETGAFANPNFFTVYQTYPSGSATLGDPGLVQQGSINRSRSYFSNASYTYNDKYSVSGSVRLDRANIFGVRTNQKGRPLWSIGGKWEISKESFYQRYKLPDLTLRATYGFQGNISPDAVSSVTLNYASNAAYTGLPYALVSNIPNPDLRWEKSGQLNIGLSFVTKNRRVFGSLEYFKKNGVDLLGHAVIDPTTGVSSMAGNFSDMRSKGVDFALVSKIINKKVQWTASIIFNYAAEKVVRYDKAFVAGQLLEAFKNIVLPIEGYPLRSVFSYRWGGLDPATGDPRIILGDTLNKTYTPTVAGAIKPTDLVYNGRYYPPYAGSVSNGFSWKGISLNVNIIYKFGHYFRRGTINYIPFVNLGWENAHKDIGLRWQKPGDEAFTNVPSFTYPDNSSGRRDNYYSRSDVLVEKADHIRMQFLNLSYNFPAKLLNRVKMQSLSIYAYVNNMNIILWRANDKGIDPDYPYLNYPPSRSYSFGIRAGF